MHGNGNSHEKGILIRIPWEWNSLWCSDENENGINDVGMGMPLSPEQIGIMPSVRRCINAMMTTVIISIIIHCIISHCYRIELSLIKIICR